MVLIRKLELLRVGLKVGLDQLAQAGRGRRVRIDDAGTDVQVLMVDVLVNVHEDLAVLVQEGRESFIVRDGARVADRAGVREVERDFVWHFLNEMSSVGFFREGHELAEKTPVFVGEVRELYFCRRAVFGMP